MKKFLKKYSPRLLLIILILFLAEILVRDMFTNIRKEELSGFTVEANAEFLFSYTPTGRRLLPNVKTLIKNHYLSGFDVPVYTNSLGYRDDEVHFKFPRILVLGDSITLAEYLPREKSYVEVIESKLNQTKNVQVINSAVVDLGIKEEVSILKETGLKTEPSLVILSFYLNDSRPSWGFPNEIRHRSWIRRYSILAETIYNKLVLMKWINKHGADRFEWIEQKDKLDWKNNIFEFDKLVESAKYDWGFSWKRESWQSIKKDFEELKALSIKNNFKLLIVGLPVSFQVKAVFNDSTPQEYLKNITDDLELDFLDLLPMLREHQDLDLYYDQCHPTALGHKIMGNYIAEYIKKENLI